MSTSHVTQSVLCSHAEDHVLLHTTANGTRVVECHYCLLMHVLPPSPQSSDRSPRPLVGQSPTHRFVTTAAALR
ncbi:MAG: hypothetical protein HZA46_06820 [Planctomycetales bacterium]|nr:hypothetical protein [Planctomycetales bacterium]